MKGIRQQTHLSLSADGTQLRKETLNGVQYIVVPCVSKIGDNVEWPINSDWPVFIPADVLSLATDNRNYRPVVLDHPQNEQGVYVSANSPDILDKYAFGFVFGAQFVDNKVQCEMWLDRTRAAIVGPEAVKVIDRLESGETIEVSEGNFVLYERTDGEFNGKKYGAIWHACWSDHLATLPEGAIGACSVNDGCGARALNVSSASASASTSTSPTSIVYILSALSQARTPTFSGTETSTWSKPTYEECIRYLYNGDNPPKSVAQCSSDLKRTIASHSLMGDPEANNYADLTSCMCVSVSSGKLNERALRNIVNGRSMSGLSDSQKKSAIDTAQRLLNSEFSANLQSTGQALQASTVSASQESSMDKKKESILKRIIASMTGALQSSMSNNDLRWKLYKAIEAVDPGISFVHDEDLETKTVLYCVVIRRGDIWSDGDSEYHNYMRTFSVDDKENVTVNDDAVEIEWYQGWKPLGEPTPKMQVDADADSEIPETEIVNSTQAQCDCHLNQHNQHTRENAMDQATRQKIIGRLCAQGAVFAGNNKALEAMNDASLESLDKTYPAQASQVSQTSQVPQVPQASTTSETTSQPQVSFATDTVTISKEEYTGLKSVLECHQQQVAARRSELITSITNAQKAHNVQNGFSDTDLQALEMPVLEKLAVSLNANQPVQVQAGSSYVGLPMPANSAVQMRKLPDTWGLSKKKAQDSTVQN